MKQQPIEFAVGPTFGVAVPDQVRVPGFDIPGPWTPPAQSGYRFRKDLLADVLGWYQGRVAQLHPDGLWLTGPMGAGKSSVIREIAARLNLNLVQANGQRRLEMADLIGHLTAIGGDVVFQEGPLARAVRQGWLFLLDEADLMDPSELAGLNTLLDGGPLVITANGGEVVTPAPGFGVICTANTAGSGDATGLYAGVQRQNHALLDRFGVVEVDYPDPLTEIELVAAASPELPRILIERMVSVAQEVRRLFVGTEDQTAVVEITFSTRTLIRWAYQLCWFRNAPHPVQYALRRALTARAEPQTAAAIDGIVQRVFGDQAS